VDVEQSTERGFRHLQEGKWSYAMGAFRDVLDVAPDHAPAHYGLGRVFTETGYTDGAEQEFQAAVRLDTTYGEAYLGLAGLYYRLGRYEEAERNSLLAARHGAGETADALYLQGLFAERGGDYWEAEARMRGALRLAPGDVRYRLALVDLLRRRGRYDDALSELERERFPRGHDKEIRVRLADCRLHLGQVLEAERLYRLLLNDDYLAVEPRWGLVLLGLRRGDAEETSAQLEEIATLVPPEEEWIVRDLAEMLGTPDPFFGFLTRLRELRPEAPESLHPYMDDMIRELVGEKE